ncbi:bifunctional DNA primase/polymerase, partial [Streptomyces rimosus]|uniref:bifunctional DNA primase/polymerase n=1 Tax=Streptomyces rimosus TaxID=1927 RepID=UPI0031D1BA8A
MASPHSTAMDTPTGSHPSTPVDGPAHRSAGASIDRFTCRSPRPGHPYRREDHHSTALTHALVAAGRGYAVIPLTRAKLPAVRSPHHADQATAPCRGACGQLGHGIHDATSDPLAVRRLFAAAPWATAYGIACGVPPYHLIGIDLDTKHGADGLTALRLLAEEHHVALPPTVTVRTPSGGHHLYFSGPPSPPIPNSAGRLAPGIDIRGTGGYLVGPGSHTSRGAYTLTPGTPRTPTPAPPALLHLLTHLPHTTHPHNTPPRPTPHTPSTPAPA